MATESLQLVSKVDMLLLILEHVMVKRNSFLFLPVITKLSGAHLCVGALSDCIVRVSHCTTALLDEQPHQAQAGVLPV